MLQLDRQSREVPDSGLRLQTALRLRWFGVIGQLVTVCLVYLILGFHLPFGICLAFIALSAWLNIYLRMRYPARTRLSTPLASCLLAYDIVQLAGLLFLTGGIDNPFTFLLVAPVTVSAATLPPPNTIALGLLAATAALLLVFYHLPLPWSPGGGLDLPTIYSIGALASVLSGMVFLALYAWRLAKESRQMAEALSATELVLAREQQLHALDGLAAAAAHELGTPLSTITIVAKELAREVPTNSQFGEDLALLQAQAARCKEILKKLTRGPTEPDPLHARLGLTQLIDEAVEPYRGFNAQLIVTAAPEAFLSEDEARVEPVGERRPGVIYGLANLVENAVDFARERVEITARWSASEVVIEIADDGPGVSPVVMDALGDPYITTRPSHDRHAGDTESSGLGLGFFIAKTLLERSGATVSVDNRPYPSGGAFVKISWPRPVFERRTAASTPLGAQSQSGSDQEFGTG